MRDCGSVDAQHSLGNDKVTDVFDGVGRDVVVVVAALVVVAVEEGSERKG